MARLDFLRKFAEQIYQNISKYKGFAKLIFPIAVALCTIFLYKFNAFERLELLTLDYRFLLRQMKPVAHDVVFVDMAEDSIQSIGRWPWPRAWHATAVKALSDYGAKVIAFDVIFSEPQDGIDDDVFEEAIKQSGVVYLPFMFNLATQSIDEIYSDRNIMAIAHPLERFARWTKGTGYINASPDLDGILRRVAPLVKYQDGLFYQFGFKIGCDLMGVDEDEILFKPERHEIILKTAKGDIRVPLDENNQLILNWRNKWGKAFEHYSYIDIIKSYALIKKGEKPIVDLNGLKDKICIIGLTASGLIDIRPIPIENAYPAVGVHATVIESIFRNDFINITPRPINTLIIFLVSVVVTLILSGLRPLNGMYTAIACLIAYFGAAAFLFSFLNLSIITFYPLFAIVISYSLTATYTHLLQTIERTQLFRQATRDGLTLLYNVRHFNLLLEAEFKNLTLYKNRRISLIMMDLDNFKHLNDTYGHPAGDTILREFGGIIQSKCRQIDVPARYGGEEFIIMLVGAGKGFAVGVAEKIREALANKTFNFDGHEYKTSASIGVVEYSDERSKEELIEKADKALYQAKRGGKNRVSVYEEGASNN